MILDIPNEIKFNFDFRLPGVLYVCAVRCIRRDSGIKNDMIVQKNGDDF